MISFFKRYEYVDIRNKLLFLYGLNIIDLLMTLFLVGTGFFIEGNPLMAYFMMTPLMIIVFKLIMPAAMIAVVAVRLRTATPAQRHSSNILVNALLLSYAAVAVLHVAWIVVYYVVCL